MTPSRRVLCIVLPSLPCELRAAGFKSRAHGKTPALGVVITEQERALTPEDTLDAINETARRGGVAVGQCIAEAHAQLSRLHVRALTLTALQQALEQIAESVLQFGLNVAVHAPDTLCLDITGVAQLFGGEDALATQVADRVRSMGHTLRIAVANGPLVAQALARWANYAPKDQGVRCFHPKQIEIELSKLPVIALPLGKNDGTTADEQAEALVAWLMRCGLYSVGDLKRLPAASLSARLGANAIAVADFIQGRDETPLVPYVSAPQLSEEFEAEEGLKGVEPLLFVLKGLCARVSARLQGRAQAVRQLKLTLLLDRSIAALRGAAPSVDCELSLPTSIHRAEEMERILAARSKRLQLEAPILTVRLTVDDVTEAPALQLDISRVLQGTGGSRHQGEEVLPLLLAEISAEIGASRVGVLREVPSHIPEGKSTLQVPVLAASRHDGKSRNRHKKERGPVKRTAQNQAALHEVALYEQRSFFQLIQERKSAATVVSSPSGHVDESNETNPIKLQPTRLLPKPVPLAVKLERGATVVVGSRLFTLSEARFERRLSEIEWWSATAISRDYWRLWLTSPSGGCAALAFVERKTGKRYLQALYD